MKADYCKSQPPVPGSTACGPAGLGGHCAQGPSKVGLILPGRVVVTVSHRATEVRAQVPSPWSQDPFAPHKCHQPHLEQNGFNQLRHPHSPGSRATKRLGSCPQRTVRLKCLSTLQGPGWAGRGGRREGGRLGERKWQVAGTRESRGAPAGPWAPGCSPSTLTLHPWLGRSHGEETGEQVPAVGEAEAAVSFTNKYTSLPS